MIKIKESDSSVSFCSSSYLDIVPGLMDDVLGSYEYEEINNLLCFYKQDHIYVKRVFVKKDRRYVFYFKKFDYPYFIKDVGHLTREQTIVYITQAAYFFGLINSRYDKLWPYSYDKFCGYVDDEKMGITGLNVNFKKFVKNIDDVCLIFDDVSYRRYKGKLYGEISFAFERFCYGSIKFFIED
jgi:hypothetical protein